MDSKYEDNMVSQIEKNLSNNINENLFLTGKVFENSKSLIKRKYLQEHEQATEELRADSQEYPLVSTEHISDAPVSLSRAEYIKQAREACLRQLSNSQVYSKPYEVNYLDTDTGSSEAVINKKPVHWKLFPDGTHPAGADVDENSPQEIAAFRSLIIRTVCAIVLFISIFIIDKFELKVGNLTNNMIQEYITGNDSLKALEDVIVTWLK
jgi:hypothetical protein